MNTSTMVALIVGAVAVAGGGFLYINSSGDKKMGAGMLDAMNQEIASGNTFATVMAAGRDVQCDFTQGSGANMSSGRVYLADRGEEIRGDFTIMTNGSPMEAHLIRSNGWNYVWGSFYEQGIKTQVTAENRGSLFESKDASIPEDLTFDCAAWNVDDSMFALPGNVTFVDVAAQMEAAMPGAGAGASMQGSADMKAMQCAACDQAGPNRDQCRQALGCK